MDVPSYISISASLLKAGQGIPANVNNQILLYRKKNWCIGLFR
jgi:hypothetical protein